MKLSFKEKKELEELPTQIERVEEAVKSLETRLASPEFYREPADVVRGAVATLEKMQAELHDAYARWDALEARRNG